MGLSSAIRLGQAAARVGRGLEGFTARRSEEVELQPCGVEELDALLGGGFPRGSLVEVCGTASSGRTSLSLALLAQATGRQEACAFVDVSDALDPMSLAAAGVDAGRLLWVRCGEEGRGKPLPYSQGDHNGHNGDAGRNGDGGRSNHTEHVVPTNFGWRHPRDQIRGVETAIPSLVRETSSGGMRAQGAGRADLIAQCTGEQVEPDRQAPRRGENVRKRFLPQERMRSWEEGQERLAPKKRERDTREEKPALKKRGWSAPLKTEAYQQRIKNEATKEAWTRRSAKPWKRLEQALKTTDLLLHSGGWGVVVVDLGGISWVEARRIPMHTWFRFRRVVENTPTILLLLGEEPCAKSCASLVLRCQRVGEKWSTAASREKSFDARLGVATLQGFEVQGEIACSRMQRTAMDAARWQTRTMWNGNY